jgi:hypothetical protein
LGTPEGDKYPPIKSEPDLRNVIEAVMQRPRTKEVVEYLLRLAIS